MGSGWMNRWVTNNKYERMNDRKCVSELNELIKEKRREIKVKMKEWMKKRLQKKRHIQIKLYFAWRLQSF